MNDTTVIFDAAVPRIPAVIRERRCIYLDFNIFISVLRVDLNEESTGTTRIASKNNVTSRLLKSPIIINYEVARI